MKNTPIDLNIWTGHGNDYGCCWGCVTVVLVILACIGSIIIL